MAELYLGMARARLGPAAALLDVSRGQVAACEENRLSRARQAKTSGPPELAIGELLHYLQRAPGDVAQAAVVTDNDDDRAEWAGDMCAAPVPGHHAHAVYAAQSSMSGDTVVLVCEVHDPRGWSAWRVRTGQPPEAFGKDVGEFPLARVYGRLTEALGLHAMRDEHLIEAMARAGRDSRADLADGVRLDSAGIVVDPSFEVAIRSALTAGDAEGTRKDIAASVQRRLGECLAELLSRLSRLNGPRHLCLAGGLFFNTYFTTLATTSRTFDAVHVPPHPGRNGTALGAALVARGSSHAAPALEGLSSAYLGPAYSDAEIKEALDNCKLSYDLLHEDRLIDTVLQALSRGHLVGWFHGRLEWGPRALGHRSVLADPLALHTLDNLNGFLKRRPAYRSYGVSVPVDRVSDFFEGPSSSRFMQFEYRPKDRDRFRTILPPGVETLRVHTVDDTEPRFLRLLERWGEKTGTPVLVNTSFNGFHEPLVCSPRDAIRVFYGTGLDVLALEDFLLRK
jgi:carbamoyltransferase